MLNNCIVIYHLTSGDGFPLNAILNLASPFNGAIVFDGFLSKLGRDPAARILIR